MDAATMTARCATRFQDESYNNVSTAGWLGYLNDAYRDVLSANPDWPFLQKTTTLTVLSGARSVALPSNVLRLTSVYNLTDQYPMRAIEGGTQHIRQYPDQTVTGTPSRYRVFNNELQVWQLPEGDTQITVDYIVAPADLGGTTPFAITSHAGAAAGNVTATGVAVGDTLQSVIGVKTSDQSVHDFSSEFAITATNVINNTGGTATTGYTLIISYFDISVAAADTPVFPAQWHNLLVERALERAYQDDDQPANASAHSKAYTAMLTQMVADLLSGQQDRNPEIVDSWY